MEQQSTTMTKWLDELIDAAKSDRVETTSAGAGPERTYAYLHYQTKDGQHSALVFRHTATSGDRSVIAAQFEGDDDAIAERVAKATEAPM